MKTTSTHKEITPPGIKIHVEHVKNLTQQFLDMVLILFLMILQDISINDLPSTDKVTEAAVVTDMVRASELGMSQYKAFITDRLIKGTVKFYNPINRKKLQTGIKKFKKSPRPHCVKSVRIRSSSGPYSPAFGLKTDQKNSKYGRFSRKA